MPCLCPGFGLKTTYECGQARHLLYQNYLLTAVDDTGDSTPGEFLDKNVSKVDDMISSLGNEDASRLGNSAAEAQGWFK